MKKISLSAFTLFCAIFTAIVLTAITFASCSSDGSENSENNEDDYIGRWLSEDGAEYYFSKGGRGTYRLGDIGGTFNYTVNVTTIHMHVTYWSETYHTIWKDYIEVQYSREKDRLNIRGIFFYREGKVPKKDEVPIDSVGDSAATDTVVAE